MRLHELPQRLSIPVYDRARQSVIEKHKNTPGVLALLEFGTIPLPGISDIDFFIVVEPGKLVELPHSSEYTEDERLAIYTLQCPVTPETYEHLSYYDPWFVDVKTRLDTTGRFGDFRKKEFDEKRYAGLSLRFVHEKLVYGCLPFIAETRGTDSLRTRHFFEEAKQFKYFLREFDRVGVAYENDPNLPMYNELPAAWFTLSSEEQEKSVHDAYRAFENSVVRMFKAFTPYLKSAIVEHPATDLAPKTRMQRDLLKRHPKSFIVDAASTVFVYQQGRESIAIEREVYRLPVPQYSSFVRTIFLMPWELGALASQHLNVHGCLSDHYRRSSCTDLPVFPGYRDEQGINFLHELQNKNLWDTRNVWNSKFYEMRFNYRPAPTRYPSIKTFFRSLLTRYLRSWALRKLQNSRPQDHRTLFEARL